jgi:hypothetical protein
MGWRIQNSPFVLPTRNAQIGRALGIYGGYAKGQHEGHISRAVLEMIVNEHRFPRDLGRAQRGHLDSDLHTEPLVAAHRHHSLPALPTIADRPFSMIAST